MGHGRQCVKVAATLNVVTVRVKRPEVNLSISLYTHEDKPLSHVRSGHAIPHWGLRKKQTWIVLSWDSVIWWLNLIPTSKSIFVHMS